MKKINCHVIILLTQYFILIKMKPFMLKILFYFSLLIILLNFKNLFTNFIMMIIIITIINYLLSY